MKPLFLISCPYDTYSGYGARSRDLVKAIIKTGKYKVQLLSQPWGNTRTGFCKENPEWEFLYDHELKNELAKKPEIWAQVTVPNEFQPRGKYNIGFTAGIETTLAPAEWVVGMNRMDLNVVSSEHSKQSFITPSYSHPQTKQEVKINKPIEVLFEGADITKYFADDRPCMIDFNIKESFAYLFVGHWLQGEMGEDRKNVGLLIKAFFETFKNKRNPPALILKTSGANSSYLDRDQILNKIASIRKSCNSSTLPNVYLLHGDFTDEEMNSLYNHSKVKAMISLTKGEGFGRPLLEFSLTQKPIITTNWSGHTDFLTSEFSVLLGGKLTQIHPSAANKFLIPESEWFSVNHPEIGFALKDMFENYKKYIGNAKRQAYHSKTNFSWEAMVEKLDTILDNNIPEFPKEIELNIPKIELPTL